MKPWFKKIERNAFTSGAEVWNGRIMFEFCEQKRPIKRADALAIASMLIDAVAAFDGKSDPDESEPKA